MLKLDRCKASVTPVAVVFDCSQWPNVKDCNSDAILALQTDIKALLTSIDGKTKDYTALVTMIKDSVASLDLKADQLALIQASVDWLEALVATGNATMTDIKAAVLAIQTSAQNTDANTDTLEALTTAFTAVLQTESDQTQVILQDIKTSEIAQQKVLEATCADAFKQKVEVCNFPAPITPIDYTAQLNTLIANTATSNTNETTIISLLWDLKLNTTGLALEATQQQVLTKATAIETLLTSTNTKLDTLDSDVQAVKASVDAVKVSVDAVKTAIQTLDTNNTTWLANVVTAVNTVNASLVTLDTDLNTFKNANHADFLALNTLLQSEFDQTQTILQTEFDQTQAIMTNILAKLNETCAGSPINVTVCNQVTPIDYTALLTSIDTKLSDLALIKAQLVSANTTLSSIDTSNTTIASNTTALLTKVDTTNTKLEDIKTLLTTGNANTAQIVTQLTTVNTTLNSIRTDIAWLQTSLTAINADTTAIKASVASIDTKLTTALTKLDTLHTDLVTLNTTLQSEFDQTQVLQTATNTKLDTLITTITAPCGWAVQNVNICPNTTTIRSWWVSIANWTYTTLLWPDGTNWNNPWNLKSVSIYARKSNNTDAQFGSGSNQVLVITSFGRFVLLEWESSKWSVEDWNIQDFSSVDTAWDSAALVIFNAL